MLLVIFYAPLWSTPFQSSSCPSWHKLMPKSRSLNYKSKRKKRGKKRSGASLVKQYAMKTYEDGGITPPFLTSTLDGGEWSASRLGPFTPGEQAPNNHWTGS
jgi:hypothetical protein